MDQRERIENNFRNHTVTAEQAESLGLVRETCKDVAVMLIQHCPDSRELSLALTKLEEVMFWADAAIARTRSAEGVDPKGAADEIGY